LALKVTQLEAKNVQLEVKIQDQERRLTSFLEAAELPVSTDSKLFPVEKEISIRSTGRNGIPRTCRELRAADPSLSSGMHWIDPDGQGVGDNPIYVYCDMTSGEIFKFSIKENCLIYSLFFHENRIDLNSTRL
jgi:hypothetical protein